MTRRKGEITSDKRERLLPHLCALAEVNGGFSETYKDMLAFCRERGVHLEGGQRRAWVRAIYSTFCFADEGIADAFAARFGGVRGTAETYPPGVIGRHERVLQCRDCKCETRNDAFGHGNNAPPARPAEPSPTRQPVASSWCEGPLARPSA